MTDYTHWFDRLRRARKATVIRVPHTQCSQRAREHGGRKCKDANTFARDSRRLAGRPVRVLHVAEELWLVAL